MIDDLLPDVFFAFLSLYGHKFAFNYEAWYVAAGLKNKGELCAYMYHVLQQLLGMRFPVMSQDIKTFFPSLNCHIFCVYSHDTGTLVQVVVLKGT